VDIDCENEDCPGQEPKLYIFYPITLNKGDNNKEEKPANTFRNISKIGIKLPLKQKSS